MTETPQADALLTALISGDPQIEAFADLTGEHEREKALHVLLAMLTDPSDVLCVRAVQALGILSDRRAVEPLLAFLEAEERDFDHDRSLLHAAIDALVAIGDPQAIFPLLTNTRIYDDGMDDNVLYDKLLEFDTEDLLRVLGDVARHPDNGLRSLALIELGAIDDPRSIKLLIEALSDPMAKIRCAAAFDLGRLRAIEAVPFLLLHTADPVVEMRQYTAMALGDLGDQQAIPTLLPLLHDEGQEVRMQTAISLGKLGDASGVNLIHDYLASGYEGYRWGYFDEVLKAVKSFRAPVGSRFIRMLNRLPTQSSLKVSTQTLIAEIFAEQGDADALPLLDHMLKSDDETLRTTAQQAIARINAQLGQG